MNINNIEIQPDKLIEEFWDGFKDSMFNFYKEQENYKYCKPIKYWCELLNYYKNLKQYDKIETKIHKYISLYALDVIRSFNMRHFDLLETNVKRWKRILKQHKFSNTYDNYENIVYFCFDIIKNLIKKYKQTLDESIKGKIYLFCKEIDTILIYKDYCQILDLGLDFKMPSVIDKLAKYINLNTFIQENYVIYSELNREKKIFTLPNKISGKKIIDFLKDKKIQKI